MMSSPRFNEAAGIHRRKLRRWYYQRAGKCSASMRPPEFTGGNGLGAKYLLGQPHPASMRPPEFTGGNLMRDVLRSVFDVVASMRPPEFTGGNSVMIHKSWARQMGLQ